MKLLFIENRYKAWFYEAIISELDATHEVFWLVQNKEFTPKIGNVTIIPYPKEKDLENLSTDIEIRKVIESDRQVNFFGKEDTRYFSYYASEISNLISEINPDIVFGESTAFHELITIEVCKKFDVLYLNPSSCRYPTGRFSFYKYDTLIPYEGSGEDLNKTVAIDIINVIANRNSKPDYMKVRKIPKTVILKDKLKIAKSYLFGEQYNTPSPITKYKKEQERKLNIEKWDQFAQENVDRDNFSILYPLQMQPEANIDVWGRKHRNQLDVIKEIYNCLEKTDVLYVKPNPKSKYELSLDVIKYISSHSNIIMLSHNVSMNTVFNKIDIFVTVTGTIAIECILSNKPVITLIETLHNTAKNCLYAKDNLSLKAKIELVKNNNFPTITQEEQITFLSLLTKTSYAGIISDPLVAPNCMSEENINNMVNSFKMITD